MFFYQLCRVIRRNDTSGTTVQLKLKLKYMYMLMQGRNFYHVHITAMNT